MGERDAQALAAGPLAGQHVQMIFRLGKSPGLFRQLPDVTRHG